MRSKVRALVLAVLAAGVLSVSLASAGTTSVTITSPKSGRSSVSRQKTPYLAVAGAARFATATAGGPASTSAATAAARNDNPHLSVAKGTDGGDGCGLVLNSVVGPAATSTRACSSTTPRRTACRSLRRGPLDHREISLARARPASPRSTSTSRRSTRAMASTLGSTTRARARPVRRRHPGRVHDPANSRARRADLRGSTCACTLKARSCSAASSATRGEVVHERAELVGQPRPVRLRLDRRPVIRATRCRRVYSGTTWSVAIPTPAVGTHTIYARATQGFDTASARVEQLHRHEVGRTATRNDTRIAASPRSAPPSSAAAAASPRPCTPDLHAGRQDVGARAQPPPVCCVPAGPPVAGEPAPVNMAYFGGHVQVTPKIYLVLWGWGEPGAFDHTTPGHARERPGRRGGPHDRVRQGDGRHRVGGQPDPVLRDRSTARTSTSRTRRTSSAASGTTTRTRSTTT